ALFGVIGMIFARGTHWIGHVFRQKIAYAPLRPLLGGIVVAAAVWGLGTSRYIGLGIPAIRQAFVAPSPATDFSLKTLFTAMSLGSGLKGAEVTPLFYIGATLGSFLSRILPLATSLLAAVGFVAVFAGAANTPIACTIMAMELFGPAVGLYAGIACV